MKLQRNRAFTLIELLVVIAIIAILAAILFPVFAQAKASAKTASTLSNVKQVALAGLMYSNDYDDVVHPHQYYNNSGSPVIDAGYYWYMAPYIKSKPMLFDAARGINVDTNDPEWLWSKAVTITLNRNGWSSWETLDTFVRSYRVMTAQEDIANRAAYVITARPTALSIGYHFTSDEAACPVIVAPTTVANTRFQRVYLASKSHREKIVTAFGDGHAKNTANSQVMVFNNTVAEAEECAGYNHPQFIPPAINHSYWGTWYDATR